MSTPEQSETAIDLSSVVVVLARQSAPESNDVDAETESSSTVRASEIPGIDMMATHLVDGKYVQVQPEHLADISDLDAFFEDALERTAGEHVPEIDVEELDDGVLVMSLSGEMPFIATNALWVDRFLESPEDGLLVAVPDRRTVWIHAMHDAGMVQAMGRMLMAVQARAAEAGDDAVSDRLHWWHDGIWATIESNFSPSQDPDTPGEMALELPTGFDEIFARHVGQS